MRSLYIDHWCIYSLHLYCTVCHISEIMHLRLCEVLSERVYEKLSGDTEVLVLRFSEGNFHRFSVSLIVRVVALLKRHVLHNITCCWFELDPWWLQMSGISCLHYPRFLALHPSLNTPLWGPIGMCYSEWHEPSCQTLKLKY